MKKELLEKSLLEARKSGNKFISNTLSTMKGEIENQHKNNPTENVDLLIEAYAFKSKKNLIEFKPKDWELELEVIKPFLPKEITEQDVIELINTLKLAGTNEKAMLGVIMKSLKGVDVNLVKSLL